LLFALKLHSGRLADTRDLVVGMRADFDRIERHLRRGDIDALDERIERVIDRLEGDDFADSFKGVFQQEALSEGTIDELISVLRRQRD
jgi:hypothetical protein